MFLGDVLKKKLIEDEVKDKIRKGFNFYDVYDDQLQEDCMSGKKIITILTVFFTLVSPVLFAGGKAEVKEVSEETEKVELVIWTHRAEGLNQFTEEFNNKYKNEFPEISIEYEIFQEAAGYNTKLITAISGGGGPDIFDANAVTAGAYNARGMLSPMDLEGAGFSSLDSYSEQWAPGALDGFMDNEGNLLGIPYAYDVWQLYINIEYFAEAGLDPQKDAPKTWEDFYILAEKLHKKDSEGNTIVKGYQLPIGGPFGWYLIIWEPMLWQCGGQVFDNNQMSALDSEATKKAIKIWENIYSNYDTGCGPDYPGANPVFEFAQGESAMTIAGPWAAGTIKSISEEVYNNIAVLPLPQVDPDNPKAVFNAWGWFINTNSDNVKEATKWISRFGENSLDAYLAGVGFPPHQSVVNSDKAKEMIGYEVFINALKGAQPREGTPYYDETGEAIKKAIDDVILMNQNIDQVVARLHEEINRIQSGN